MGWLGEQNRIRVGHQVDRALAGKRKRRRPLRRLPRMRWPVGQERIYYRSLDSLLSRIEALVREELVANLPRILAKAQDLRPTSDSSDSIRLDQDYSDEVQRLMELVRIRFAGEFSETALAELARRIAEAVSAGNRSAVGRILQKVLGIDIFSSEPWLASELKAFVQSNVGLIKSMSSKLFGDVERVVYDGARRGLRAEVIAKTLLEKPFNAGRKQAALIARDQVGSFNAQVNELRQRDLGLQRYTWRGMLDERERPEHRAREGKIFRWDSPPEDGHPGEPIRCRCWAEPVVDDLLREIEGPEDS